MEHWLSKLMDLLVMMKLAQKSMVKVNIVFLVNLRWLVINLDLN